MVPDSSTIKTKIGVVIPCYMVRDQILPVLEKISPECDVIYVIDDKCPERTGEFVAQHCRDERVSIVYNSENMGVGGATLIGYEEAVKQDVDVIVKIDGDGQMNPEFIPNLVRPILENKADYTKGNRFLFTRELRSMPLLRQIGNIGLSFLVKLASGYWNIFDPTNGYTAISALTFASLNRNKLAERYFFESSTLIELGLQRAVVLDIAIPANYGDAESNLSEFRALIEFPPLLLWASIRRIIVQYFVRDFNAASLFLISGLIFATFGLLWGLYHWIRSFSIGVLASTGTVMIAVLPIILGVQFLLQFIVMDLQNAPKDPICNLMVEVVKTNEIS